MKKLLQICFCSLSFFCFCLNRILKSLISVQPLQKLDKFQIIWKQKWFLLLIEKALHHYDNDNPSEKTVKFCSMCTKSLWNHSLKIVQLNCFFFRGDLSFSFDALKSYISIIHNQIAKLITDSQYLFKSSNYIWL
jgi:hypothetical protein